MHAAEECWHANTATPTSGPGSKLNQISTHKQAFPLALAVLQDCGSLGGTGSTRRRQRGAARGEAARQRLRACNLHSVRVRPRRACLHSCRIKTCRRLRCRAGTGTAAERMTAAHWRSSRRLCRCFCRSLEGGIRGVAMLRRWPQRPLPLPLPGEPVQLLAEGFAVGALQRQLNRRRVHCQ